MLITKSFTFHAAHRLPGHKVPGGSVGRCAHLHGHTYKVVVGIKGSVNDDTGFVMDFAVVKEKIREWVMENWDHAFIVWERDSILEHVYEALNNAIPEPPRVFKMKRKPTAENMAKYLFDYARGQLPARDTALLEFIEIWETPTSMARYVRTSVDPKL